MAEGPKRRDPIVPMIAAMAALIAILLIAAAVTGQWAFLLLGVIAVAAGLVPIISRR
jgi:energy-converting hydrogenase Eha subunit E